MLPIVFNRKFSIVSKHLRVELVFHLIDLALIELHSSHQILMFISFLCIHINVALADAPMRHSGAVYVVQFVEEHACLKPFVIFLDFIPFPIQVGDTDCLWALHHAAESGEREAPLPAVAFSERLRLQLRVDKNVEVLRVKQEF